MAKEIRSPEGKTFVEEIRVAVGAGNIRSLSRMLGYNGTDREGRLYAWSRGESAPNFEGTLDLLRISGRLVEPEKAQLPAQADRPVAHGGIEAAAAEIVKEMRAGFRKLDTRLKVLETKRTVATPRSQATGTQDP